MSLSPRPRRPPTGDGTLEAPLPRHPPLAHGRCRALVATFTAVIQIVTTAVPADAARAAGQCRAPGVIAHRGYPPSGSENTLTSLRQALAAHARQVEIDIRFTRDHQPVLMHDATLDRTTNGSGLVATSSMARLRTLRGGDGLAPPALAQVLDALRGRVDLVLIELKSVPDDADARTLTAVYHRYRAYDWTALTSFLPTALSRVSFLPVAQGLLASTTPPPAQAEHYDFVSVRYDQLSRSWVDSYHAAGVHVYAWTPNTPTAWRRLAGYGVDRIITDRSLSYSSWAVTLCSR